MDELLTALVRGVAQGSLYALLGLGFVVVFKASGVVNFAQPAIMLFGALATSVLAVDHGVWFPLALLFAVTATAAGSAVVERVVMRPMISKPPFAAAMVTIGLFIAAQVVASNLVGLEIRQLGDPWGLDRVDVGGVRIFHSDIAKLVAAVVVVTLLNRFFAVTRTGLAMRAAAHDQEVAIANGVPIGRLFGTAWAIAGALAALAGMFLGVGGVGIDTTTALLALKALPGVVLGGFDSIKGAIVGGVVVGVLEAVTKTYGQDHLAALGNNFDQVVPYVLLLGVLLVRPYGLFGSKDVLRP